MSDQIVISHIRLLPSFDPALLAMDLSAFNPEEYITHFNKRDYVGDWSVLPLRSIDGSPTRIWSDPTGKLKSADTPYLDRAPYFRHVIEQFGPSVGSARLMRLGVGAEILRHTDLNLGIESGEVRIHVPVQTNDQVDFFVNDEFVKMEVGECWYLNFNLPHRAKNNGTTDRVHLVIDCSLDDLVKSRFPQVELQTAIDFPATKVFTFIDPP